MKSVLLTSTCFVTALIFSPAGAQTIAQPTTAQATPLASQAEAPAQSDGAALTSIEEVVVTGSRIARRDFVSDRPIVTLSADQIRNTGSVNIESVLNRLPQFVPGQGAYTQAQGGRATLNLRGLGEQRNLILLDGRRLPPATALGVVNINIIPKDILGGVETISGGASATYGSDAISGVVNFKTLRRFDGVQIDAQQGVSDRGDVSQTNINVAAGTSDADDKSHVLISAGFYRRGALYGANRDFFRDGAPSSFIPGGTYQASGSNLPTATAINGVFGQYGVAPGTVNTGSALGFNDNGTLFSQAGGVNYLGAMTPLMHRINGSILSPVAVQTDAASSETRYSLFSKFDHEFSDAIKVYGQALYVDDKVAGSAGFVPSILAVPSIPVTNPYIPNDLRTILASRPNPNANFTYTRRFENLPQRIIEDHSTTYQVLAGAGGKLGIGDLTWDLYGSRGETRTVQTFQNAVLLSRVNALLAAPNGGSSICAGGFNPFGVANGSNLSQACKDYVRVDTHSVTTVKQDNVEGQVQGKLFTLPAGEVRFALSANYRRDRYDFSPDATIAGGDVMSAVIAPRAQGRRHVTEEAVEVFIPLLRDAPFAQSLDLDLAYRASQYTISGDVSTYKASTTWKPVSVLMVRGGYEHAIRAPGLAEMFATASGSLAQFGVPPSAGDPCDSRSVARTGANAAAIRAICVATGVPAGIVDNYAFTTNAIIGVSSGSTALDPEKADTITLGVVLQPKLEPALLGNLSFSADYYDIKLTKAISPLAPGTVVNKCYNLDGSNPTYAPSNFYCQFIQRDGSGGIARVSTPYLNLGGVKTRGVDFALDWSAGLGAFGLDDRFGRLALNATVSWLQHYKVSTLPGNPYLEFAETIDSTPAVGLVLPRWRSQANLTYSINAFELGLTWAHVPGMKDVTSVTRPTSPAKGVGAYDRFDLQAAWRVNAQYEVRLAVNNLLDRDPLQVAGTPGLTQAGTYDIVGRAFMLSLRAKF